jgi:hypothetical protein
MMARVTRWGDFSPMEQLFTLGSLFENYKNKPNFGIFFNKLYPFILSQKGFGNILGHFITNASCHTASGRHPHI